MSLLKKIVSVFAFIASGIIAIVVGFFMLRGTMRMWDRKNTREKTSEVPIADWIRNTAKWWGQDTISDSEFVSAMQFLIQQGILEIPQTQKQTTTNSDDIPDWIKNNANWWADGKIDDKSFIQGIQFLIQQGIIVL